MKNLLFLASFILVSLSLSAQTVIENPQFSATTAEYVKIKKIELHDTVTKVDFEVKYFPNWWIQVKASETYLQSTNGGEKYYVKRAEGIQLEEHHWTPESGVNNYTLYFPPLDKDIEKIDFLGESWRIFDIELRAPRSAASIIPDEIQGNWLKTDGSNAWDYGFYKDKVIYKNKVWNSVLISTKGKNYRLVLIGYDGNQEELFVKRKKDKLLVGRSTEALQEYSKTKVYNKDFVLENDEKFKPPVFKEDTAIYKGYIKGYHSKMGKTGMVYVNNIITQNQDSHMIEIAPDGTFECKIPMIYPQTVFVRMLAVNESIFLEPGGHTFHFIDFSEYIEPFKTWADRNQRTRKSLFMGDAAKINADLQATNYINFWDYAESEERILDMTGKEYKAYCLDLMAQEKEALDKYLQARHMSQKSIQLKSMQIEYRAYENILSYNMNKESAYRRKNKIPRDQREIPIEPEIFAPAYYDFIDIDDLNNPISILSDAYDIVINRVSYAEGVKPKANHSYLALKEYIIQQEIALSSEVERIIDKLVACEDYECINEVITANSVLWTSFVDQHGTLVASSTEDAYHHIRMKNLNEYFGLNEGLVSDILYAQYQSGIMRGSQKPFLEADKDKIKKNIEDAFIEQQLIQASDYLEKYWAEKIEANKTKAGYVINETPKTDGDKLFDAIMEKYKGKVVFVDFWATWCGPCRSGIENIKPLKEEMKDMEIEFVYITDLTSPLDTWNMMVPDIKGEHYRLSSDEWNYLASKFNISGIPHYVLVDKKGTVVNDKVYFASSNSELKRLFNQYLEVD